MTNPYGSFIWYELQTPDPDASKAFYDAVVGWTIESAPAGPMDYRMITATSGNVGGVMRLTREMVAGGAVPGWMPYLHVADVDQAVAAITDDGGTVYLPAFDIEAGRIAMVADPQGVPLYIMTPTPPADNPDATSDVFSPTEVQHISWNELASPDLAASKRFYAGHFGFEFNESMPMGPAGDYCFIDHHGVRLGAIMQRQDDRQPARWLSYFRVASVAAAKAAVEAGGGTVLVGPIEVPGGDHIIVAIDPQGAGFGIVGGA